MITIPSHSRRRWWRWWGPCSTRGRRRRLLAIIPAVYTPISNSYKHGQYNIVDNLVHHRKKALRHQEHMKILPGFRGEQTFQVETFVVELEVVEVVEVDNA